MPDFSAFHQVLSQKNPIYRLFFIVSQRKKVTISGKYSFICYCTIMGIIFTISLIASIIDHTTQLIDWPTEYENTIGVILQIVVTIITMIISIIGISISLQNENIFSCKLTTLYALRKRKHYSILQIIIISISLCTLNIIFYMLNLKYTVNHKYQRIF